MNNKKYQLRCEENYYPESDVMKFQNIQEACEEFAKEEYERPYPTQIVEID